LVDEDAGTEFGTICISAVSLRMRLMWSGKQQTVLYWEPDNLPALREI
jgi:hypothetical protein